MQLASVWIILSYLLCTFWLPEWFLSDSFFQSFHGNKLKLLQRSHAMREDTSPPPPMEGAEGGIVSTSNNLTVCLQGSTVGSSTRRRLRHQGSSGGSLEGSSPCLSRGTYF